MNKLQKIQKQNLKLRWWVKEKKDMTAFWRSIDNYRDISYFLLIQIQKGKRVVLVCVSVPAHQLTCDLCPDVLTWTFESIPSSLFFLLCTCGLCLSLPLQRLFLLLSVRVVHSSSAFLVFPPSVLLVRLSWWRGGHITQGLFHQYTSFTICLWFCHPICPCYFCVGLSCPHLIFICPGERFLLPKRATERQAKKNAKKSVSLWF